ncbi:GNAT family N-acetyltransferase [Micromonospora sp. GCM10011542]|uniref:GNAT family N-acetyltransferase n=1 Tax=Micromonospora sp. GCM10011542 TaxID=3317337 RepID=UPI003618AEB8
MSPPHVRRRRPADLDGCVTALALVHRADRYPLNWPADPQRWLRDAEPAWVAVDDAATIVGHVAVRPLPAPADGPPARPSAEVSRFFVVPTARGSALGGVLLAEVRRWAAERGRDLILEVVAENAAAIARYEQAGWRYAGTTTADWTAPDGRPVALRHYRQPADPAPPR